MDVFIDSVFLNTRYKEITVIKVINCFAFIEIRNIKDTTAIIDFENQMYSIGDNSEDLLSYINNCSVLIDLNAMPYIPNRSTVH